MEFFQYFDIDQVSENGKLLNKTSYVFITLDAQNMADEPILFTWNAMLIFASDLEGYLISDDTLTSWEMRYRSGEQQKRETQRLLCGVSGTTRKSICYNRIYNR